MSCFGVLGFWLCWFCCFRLSEALSIFSENIGWFFSVKVFVVLCVSYRAVDCQLISSFFFFFFVCLVFVSFFFVTFISLRSFSSSVISIYLVIYFVMYLLLASYVPFVFDMLLFLFMFRVMSL